MSLFRKPKKNLRNRVDVDKEDDEEQNNELDEIHSSINKLKEKKKDKKKKESDDWEWTIMCCHFHKQDLGSERFNQFFNVLCITYIACIHTI